MIALCADAADHDAVLFTNADWRLLADGLEHKATGYFIARDALAARHGDGLWSWPLHLSEKSWCAPRLFREAFLAALDRFGIARDEALTRSFVAGFGMGFGMRPGAGGANRDGFVALGELLRSKPSARKRPAPAEAKAGSGSRSAGMRIPVGVRA